MSHATLHTSLAELKFPYESVNFVQNLILFSSLFFISHLQGFLITLSFLILKKNLSVGTSMHSVGLTVGFSVGLLDGVNVGTFVGVDVKGVGGSMRHQVPLHGPFQIIDSKHTYC